MSRIVGDKLSAKSLANSSWSRAGPAPAARSPPQAVARAEPDGYTLMMINDNHAVNPSVFKSIPYDSFKDFALIGFVGSAPMALSVNAQPPGPLGPANWSRSRKAASPGSVSYASVGPGSASHLAGELFAAKSRRSTCCTCRSRGGAPAINDLVAGHVNAMFLTAVVGMQQMKTGTLSAAGDCRAAAVRDAARGPDHGGGRRIRWRPPTGSAWQHPPARRRP